MTKKTEDTLLACSLVDLLSFQELNSPPFQRHYGWGENGAEQGLKYFDQFLTNLDAHCLFGIVHIYAQRRWDYERDTGIVAWLTDGQHRLVTVVLAGMSIARHVRVIAATASTLSYDDQRSLDALMDSQELQAIEKSSLEVRLAEFGRVAPVAQFIKESLGLVANHETKRQEIQSRYAEKLEAIRANPDRDQRNLDKKSNTRAKNAELAQLSGELDSLEKIGVFNTYQQIDRFLGEKNVSNLLHCAKNFLTRIIELKPTTACVQPKPNTRIELSMLEAESFAMFADINGKATPLTAGELLCSAIQSLVPARPALKAFFKNGTQERAAMEFFGLDSPDDICEYLAKMDQADNPKPYSWVRDTLYSGTPNRAKVNDIESWLTTLVQFRERIRALRSPWAALYNLFYRDFARLPYAVFVTRCVSAAGIEKCDEQFMQALLKSLVLFEVSAVYRTPSNTRFNVSRDVPLSRFNSPAAGLSAVQHHFEAASMPELQSAMAQFMTTAPLGQTPTRKLAKVLLVLADVNNGGRDVQLPAWASYEYEHVFPMKHDNLLCETGLTPEALAGIEEVLALPDVERKGLLQLLGNGALLNKSENATLSNWPPYTKYARQRDEARYSNAYWPSHLKSLQDSNGNYNAPFIRERSKSLAEEVAAFLLSSDTWATFVAPEAPTSVDGFVGIDQLSLRPATVAA